MGLYYSISLLLVFLMIIFSKFHTPSNMATSRGYYVLYFIITMAISIVFTGLMYFLFKYNINDKMKLLNNIITIQYFYLIVTIISLYITSKNKNYADITNIVIFVITILVIIIDFHRPSPGGGGNVLNSKDYFHIIILLIIITIMSIVTITDQFFKNKLYNFFDVKKYGYLCPKKNFKDVVLGETHLICPKTK